MTAHLTWRHTLLVYAVALSSALGLLLAGCSDTEGAASRSTTSTNSSTSTIAVSTTPSDSANVESSGSTPESSLPKVGECLEAMTPIVAEQLRLPERVSCDEPHGGEVISVSEVTGSGTDGAGYPGVGDNSPSVVEAFQSCTGSPGTFGDFVGSNAMAVPTVSSLGITVEQTWRISSLTAAAFLPGPAAWDRGERWFVCAAVVVSARSALSFYEGTAAEALSPDGPLEEAFGWCKRQNPDAARDEFELVSCADPHNYEQVASADLSVLNGDYPGGDDLESLSSEVCATLINEATGGTWKESEQFGLGWTFPTEPEWVDGNRTVRCFIVSVEKLTTGSVGSGNQPDA